MPTRKNLKPGRTGVWIAGARGDIATTLMVGTLAMRREFTSRTGLTTELPPMNQLALPALDDLVFGGVDILPGSLQKSAEMVYRNSRTFSRELLDAVNDDFAAIDDHIVTLPGMRWNPQDFSSSTPSLSVLAGGLRAAIRDFLEQNQLERVVVVNLTSSEPRPVDSPQQQTLDGLERLLADDRRDLVSPGILYAYAALLQGCPYLNFTPNSGLGVGAIRELAERARMPYYGDDGKTGETLVKTALAPMFACRNLRILSWEGVNMLGNSDGRTLDDPTNRAGKLENKGQVLERILDYTPHGDVTINYVPSLGDWKTAWDLIHFRGFLDVEMSMQFTWQGCDSILAAPLVLDMVRLSGFAAAQGEWGPMVHLAAFFKNPLDVEEMAFFPQFEMLLEYTRQHLSNQTTEGSYQQF